MYYFYQFDVKFKPFYSEKKFSLIAFNVAITHYSDKALNIDYNLGVTNKRGLL